MSVNKSDSIGKVLSQKDPRITEILSFLDEITDQLIYLTKKNFVVWIPYSEFNQHSDSAPKRFDRIINRQMENGLILSQESSYFLEYNGNYFFSVCYKRIGSNRTAYGIIVASSKDSNDGYGVVNSPKSIRLYNLIRYNKSGKEASDEENQINYLKSVIEDLKNEQHP